MLTLLEVIRRFEVCLAESGIHSPRREAEELIAEGLNLKRVDLYLQFNRLLDEETLLDLTQAIQRRAHHEPLIYIFGKMAFGGLDLTITPDVLIPRPETEILVEKIATTLKHHELVGKCLWDMCCGSGCIGLALKKRYPQLQVVLSDLSEKALAVARKNAHDEVEFLHGNLFKPYEGLKCDFFVCNPPYVSEVEYISLLPEVHKEPKMALVGGEDGLYFYRKIASDLKKYLNKFGLIWLELGAGQGKKVKEIFEDFHWEGCCFEQDWSGNDRFFYAQYK